MKTIVVTPEEVVMLELAIQSRVIALGGQISMHGDGALATQMQRMQGELMVLLAKVRA